MSLLRKIIALTPLIILFSSGCAHQQQTYDYSAYNQSKPHSIVVIPPANNSLDVNAPYIYLSTITKPLAERGYYVFPVSVIDNLMKANGLPTPAEMNAVPLDKIDEIIGADAVLYVTIEKWGQKYQVTDSASVVSVKLKLVDVKTGVVLWQASDSARQSSNNGNNNGLAGMLIGALITQVVSSSVDNTPALSRGLNQRIISNANNGLPLGPYAKADVKTP